MPQVKTEARDGIVYFLDGVGTSETTYTYPNPQSEFTLQNTGTRRLIWSVGPYLEVIVNPGETVTRQMEYGVSTFIIRAEYHYQSFAMSSKEMPVENPSIIGRMDELEESITTQLADIAINVKTFGAKGDGVTDDSIAITNALNYVKSVNGKLKNEKNKTYLIKQKILIDTTGVNSLQWDLNGSTIDFATGGNITLGSQGDVAYKTTTLSSDLLKGDTKFNVTDASGVQKGDLISIQSPVEWATGIPLVQTYTIGDVDVNTIYVDGVIVGDISERQKIDAGKSGNITVSFYKLSHNLVLKNGTLISKNRDSDSTMFRIMGQENYLIENVIVKQPNRSGVYVMYSGTGKFVNCRTLDHGYAEKDQGYNSQPDDPEGLGYGYGFIVANNYLTHFLGCHSFSGWHGFDVARGQSNAVFNDCVIHKDAFGFSSHEGSWIFQITNCKVFGGSGITSRSSELFVIGNTMKTNLGRCIIGNGSHQRLIIKNNIFDVSSSSDSNVFYFDTPYSEYCYSLESPYSEVSSNTIIGLSNSSRLKIRGKLVFKNNTITYKIGKTNYITITSNNNIKGEIEISNNHIFNAGQQFPFEVIGNTKELYVAKNEFRGAASLSNGALIYLSGTHEKIIMKDNDIVGIPFLIRVLSGYSTFILFQNNLVMDGHLITSATENGIIKNAINNTFKTAVSTGTITITNSINNNVLSL